MSCCLIDRAKVEPSSFELYIWLLNCIKLKFYNVCKYLGFYFSVTFGTSNENKMGFYISMLIKISKCSSLNESLETLSC